MDFKRLWLSLLIVLSVVGSAHSADIRTGGGHVIYDETTALPQRSNLKFSGQGISCTNPDSSTTECNAGLSGVPAANYYVAGHMSPAELINFDKTEGGSAGGAVNQGALRFDGVDDWVSVADQAGFDDNELSISFWIYSPSNTSSIVLSHTSSTSGIVGYRVQANAGISGPIIQFVSNGGFITSNTAEMTLNTWYFVVITISSTTGRDIYYNNSSVYTDESNYTAAAADCAFRIGVRTTSTCSTFVTPYLKATLDDLRIYKTILLTAGERTTLYNSGYGQTCSAGAQTNLVSCWGFNETEVTTATDSKSGYNGTLTNFPVTAYVSAIQTTTTDSGWVTDPWELSVRTPTNRCLVDLNGCLWFDGINSFGEVRDIDDIDFSGASAKFTVEAWIFPRISNAIQSIVEKYDSVSGKGGYALRMNALGYLEGIVVNGTDITTNKCAGTAAVSTYVWHHVAMTFDATDGIDALKCYVDGSQVGTTTTVTFAPLASDTYLKFGAIGTTGYHATSVTQPFNGLMDEIAIWKVSLSGGEVASRYDTGTGIQLAGTETNLEAVWHFNDGAGVLASQSVNPDSTGSVVGNDSNDCITTTTPCKTIQGALGKIPKFFAGSSMVHIASGIYPEEVIARGFNPSGDFSITINGHINPIPNNFNNVVSGIPTDVASIGETSTKTSTGSNTALFPKDERSLFKDTNTTFTADVDGQLLKLTGGTGFKSESGYDYVNWYRTECAAATTFTSCGGGTLNALSVVTKWSNLAGDSTGITPSSDTTYKVFYEKYMPQIHGGGFDRYRSNSVQDGIRETNMQIMDSAGLLIRKMRFTGAKAYSLKITTSSLDEISTSTFDYSGYSGLWFEDSFGKNVIANKFYKNRNEGYILFQNSGNSVSGKNYALENWGPGIAAYFSSSILVLNSTLVKNNEQNNIDFEFNSTCVLTSYLRSESTSTGRYGLAIGGGSSFGVVTDATIVGPSNGDGIIIQTSAHFETYGNIVAVEIKNARYGIVIWDGKCQGCTSTVSFSGNTYNVYYYPTSMTSYDYGSFVYEYDDFISGSLTSGGVGKLGWQFNGTGTPVVSNSPFASTTGGVRISPSATDGDNIYFCMKTCTATTGLFDISKDFDMTAIISLPSIVIANMYAYVCMADNAITNYLCFSAKPGTSTWKAIATGSADGDTGIALAADTWVRLRMAKAGNSIVYYINNVKVSTLTTTITSGQFQPQFFVNTSSTPTKMMDIDFFSITMPSPGR